MSGGGDFGSYLYVMVDPSGSSEDGIVRIDPNGSTTDFVSVSGPRGMVFGPHGDFGPGLYVVGRNATILSGVEANEVDQVLTMVRSECHARSEYVPVQALPFFGEGTAPSAPVEVRVGGAIVFVVNVEQFEKT